MKMKKIIEKIKAKRTNKEIPALFRNLLFQNGVLCILALTFTIAAFILMPRPLRNIGLLLTALFAFQTLRYQYIIYVGAWDYIERARIIVDDSVSKGFMHGILAFDSKRNNQTEVFFEDLDTGQIYNTVMRIEDYKVLGMAKFRALVPTQYTTDINGVRYIAHLYQAQKLPSEAEPQTEYYEEEGYTEGDYPEEYADRPAQEAHVSDEDEIASHDGYQNVYDPDEEVE